MSEVKRFDVPSMRSLTQGEQAVMGYEVVLASDYDALVAKLAMAEDAAAREMLPASSAAAWRWRSRSFAPNSRHCAQGWWLCRSGSF